MTKFHEYLIEHDKRLKFTHMTKFREDLINHGAKGSKELHKNIWAQLLEVPISPLLGIIYHMLF